RRTRRRCLAHSSGSAAWMGPPLESLPPNGSMAAAMGQVCAVYGTSAFKSIASLVASWSVWRRAQFGEQLAQPCVGGVAVGDQRLLIAGGGDEAAALLDP